MPGGVAAMPVTKHGNFDTKYPRVLPQTCRGASDVCARVHSHYFAYADVSGSPVFTADLAQSQKRTHGEPGSAHAQKHKQTHTRVRPEGLLIH